MYSIVLLAAMTATEKAPAHGWVHTHGYGACYGGCYGNCYTGWPHLAGGWGLPYGGYYGAYTCPAHGGYPFGAHTPLLTPAATTFAPVDARPEEKKEKLDDKKEPDEKKKDKIDDKDKKKEGESKTQARARLHFELPRGAALYVDGTLIEKADERKSFRTPALERGEQYYYELRVEVIRDGQKHVETKRVTVSAGDDIKTDFSNVGRTTGVANAESPR